MMGRGALGLAPWDVLHSGVTRFVPFTLGQVVILFSFIVLLAWIPLREKPGIGTLLNSVVVGLAADATLALLVEPSQVGWRIALMLAGVALTALATAPSLGAQFGRGPRAGIGR